jgi:hypothetical protein
MACVLREATRSNYQQDALSCAGFALDSAFHIFKINETCANLSSCVSELRIPSEAQCLAVGSETPRGESDPCKFKGFFTFFLLAQQVCVASSRHFLMSELPFFKSFAMQFAARHFRHFRHFIFRSKRTRTLQQICRELPPILQFHQSDSGINLMY